MKKANYLYIPIFALASLSAQAATSTLFNDTFSDGTLSTATTLGDVNGGFAEVDINASGNGDVESGGFLTHNSTGSNDRSGILSTSAFDVTSYDSFTVTWVVNSSTVSSANGFHLGLSSTAGSFDNIVSFIFEPGTNTANNIYDLNIGGVNYANDFAATSSTIRDGFTLTATFDATGITYSAADATMTGGSIAYQSGQTYASLFDSTMFVGANIQASGATDAQFVMDSILVTAIPEPGNYALLAGFLGLCYVMVRRRQA